MDAIVLSSLFGLMLRSCVADNPLGRAKKYIEVSGRPGPAQFHSPLYSRSRDVYNLTWSVESVPKLEEIRILYRKLMVSDQTARNIFAVSSCSGLCVASPKPLHIRVFVAIFPQFSSRLSPPPPALVSNPIKVFIAIHVIHILRLHL
jgi:hypothetical protein